MRKLLLLLMVLLSTLTVSAAETEAETDESVIRFGGYFDISYPIPVGDNYLSEKPVGPFKGILGADIMGLMTIKEFYVIAIGGTIKVYRNDSLENILTFAGFQTLFGIHIPITQRLGIVPSIMGSYGINNLYTKEFDKHERDAYVSVGAALGPVYQLTRQLGIKATISYRFYYTFVEEEADSDSYHNKLHILSPRLSFIVLI